MLKDTEKYRSQTHFSNNNLPPKMARRGSGNRDLTIFISVFVIGVLIILGFAKILSPNVDVGIAADEEFMNLEENTTQSVIDERLRKLQLEEFARRSGDEEMFSPELDEKVVLPKQLHKTVGEMEAEMLNKKLHEQKAEEPKAEEKIEVVENSPELVMHNSQNVTARVVVGYYATEKQAEVAKSIIQDAGLGVTPLVKNMGTYYTLQVGSYSSKDKAQQAANNLLKNNFPARVVVE